MGLQLRVLFRKTLLAALPTTFLSDTRQGTGPSLARIRIHCHCLLRLLILLPHSYPRFVSQKPHEGSGIRHANFPAVFFAPAKPAFQWFSEQSFHRRENFLPASNRGPFCGVETNFRRKFVVRAQKNLFFTSIFNFAQTHFTRHFSRRVYRSCADIVAACPCRFAARKIYDKVPRFVLLIRVYHCCGCITAPRARRFAVRKTHLRGPNLGPGPFDSYHCCGRGS